MFLTRLGFGSKAVVTGDITQIDLPNPKASGLVRGAAHRQGREGHRLRLLRRHRRGPPQAGAADRAGLRRYDARRPEWVTGLRVEVVGLPAAARWRWAAGCAAWLRRAPAALVTVAVTTDRRVRALNRRLPRHRRGHRRAVVSGRRAGHARRHRHRARRRRPSGARGRPRPRHRAEGAGPARPAAPARLRPRARTAAGWRASRHDCAARAASEAA